MRDWVLRALLAVALAWGAPGWARTEPVAFEVSGTRFVADAADGMGGFVSQAQGVIDATWPDVAARSGAPAGETIRVHIELAFVDWFEREGVPARPPEWAAGLAIPSRRVVLLAPGNPAWEQTLRHELSHVAVALASGDRDVPRWFNEGFAMRAAGQWDLERASTLLRATVGGGLHDFREITGWWPSDAGRAQVAYAQSHHFVRWCEERFGEDVFARVLALVRQGQPFAEAFRRETGMLSTVAFDRWEESIQVGYRWAPIGVGGGIAWVVASAAMLVGWRRRRRRRDAALRRMQEAERGLFPTDPDDTTFG